MCTLYANTTIFFFKGIQHLWILVSEGGPGTNPLWRLREDFIFTLLRRLSILSKPAQKHLLQDSVSDLQMDSITGTLRTSALTLPFCTSL